MDCVLVVDTIIFLHNVSLTLPPLINITSINRMNVNVNKYLRGDFLESHVFFVKSAQNLVTKPAGENPLAAIIFSNKFSKICENLKNFTGSLAT